MIRGVVLHLLNEQPLLIDVFDLPAPSDTALVGTNLRTMSGTRPLFASYSDSTFVFPYAHVRFVELPAGSGDEVAPNGELALQAARAEPGAEPEPELDEEFLRRVRDD